MTSESDKATEESKDRTKWIWLGILALIAGMVVAFWAAGRQSFEGKSVVRAKHILIQFDARDPSSRASAVELITDLRQRILDGENFSKLARENSNDTYSSARGGDLGYQLKGAFEEAFEKYVWEAPLGEVSEPITTSHGFHLIVVVDRKLAKADQYEMQLLEQAIKKEATAPASTEGGKTP